MSAHQGRWEVSWAKQKRDSVLKDHFGTLELWALIDYMGDWPWGRCVRPPGEESREWSCSIKVSQTLVPSCPSVSSEGVAWVIAKGSSRHNVCDSRKLNWSIWFPWCDFIMVRQISHMLPLYNNHNYGFPRSSVGKESACNSGDPGSIPGLGRCPGEGNGNSPQYSYLENPMDKGAW